MSDRYNSKIAYLVGLLNGCRAYAVTISGSTTLYSKPKEYVDKAWWWRKHEDAHKAQAQRMGLVKYYTMYLYYSLKYGYHNNPMEVEARQAEQ